MEGWEGFYDLIGRDPLTLERAANIGAKMTCREFSEFLDDYWSGALSAEGRAVFEAHLGQCVDCANYLNSYRRTIELGKEAVKTDEPTSPDIPEELIRAVIAARRRVAD